MKLNLSLANYLRSNAKAASAGSAPPRAQSGKGDASDDIDRKDPGVYDEDYEDIDHIIELMRDTY